MDGRTPSRTQEQRLGCAAAARASGCVVACPPSLGVPPPLARLGASGSLSLARTRTQPWLTLWIGEPPPPQPPAGVCRHARSRATATIACVCVGTVACESGRGVKI
jgi:hypothetical protein